MATPAGAATQFTLTGHGWGHGIGFSQYGALGYAQHGWKYPAILTHYFTGTHIAPATTTFNERVLLLDGVAHVDLTFSSPANVGAKGAATEAVPAGKYRIQLGTTAGRLQLVNRGTGRLVRKGLVPPVVATPLATSLQLNQPAGMWDANHHWRGSLHIHKSGNRLMLVDWIPIEKYVGGRRPQRGVGLVADSRRAHPGRGRALVRLCHRNPGRVFDATLSDQTYGPIEREAAPAPRRPSAPNATWSGSGRPSPPPSTRPARRPHLVRGGLVGHARPRPGISQAGRRSRTTPPAEPTPITPGRPKSYTGHGLARAFGTPARCARSTDVGRGLAA